MVRIPVYFDLNGIHQIAIFEQTDDGTFRRTSVEPMRLLRDNIEGIGPVVGELICRQHDREQRIWHSPTVISMNRPYSYYHFLRQQLKSRKIFVFSRTSRSTRITRLQMHELKLKATASVQVRSLLTKKLIEAIELDPEHVSGQDSISTSNIA